MSKGGENMVADALLRMPEGGEGLLKTITAVLNVSTDPKLSEDIKTSYKSDAFCQKVLRNLDSFTTIC